MVFGMAVPIAKVIHDSSRLSPHPVHDLLRRPLGATEPEPRPSIQRVGFTHAVDDEVAATKDHSPEQHPTGFERVTARLPVRRKCGNSGGAEFNNTFAVSSESQVAALPQYPQ